MIHLPRLPRITALLPVVSILFLALTALARAGSPPVVYVDADATGTPDGDSWASAYASLQDGLVDARALAASGPVEIWVAAGIYRPDQGSGLTDDDRTLAFVLDDNIQIIGGFSGNESTLEERDWVANPTVLSGDIDQNDTVDGDGVTIDSDAIVGGNSIHVTRGRGLTTNTVLDGLIVTGGLADGDGSVEFDNVHLDNEGAGINVVNSAVSLRNLRVQGNEANPDSGIGGGISIFEFPGINSPPAQIENLEILNNRAFVGGGMSLYRTRAIVDGCRLHSNEAFVGGALIVAFNDTSFENCRIEGNRSEEFAGGVSLFRAQQVWVNSRITGNYTEGDGGGIHLDANSAAVQATVITNSVISGNKADGVGGGIFRTPSDLGQSRLYNSIVWGNQDSSGAGTASANHGGPGGSNLVPEHSLVQGFAPGGDGNLDGTLPGNAPQFLAPIDPATAPSIDGDYQLAPTSPLIDQGDNAARINLITDSSGPTPPRVPLEGNIFEDLAGQARIVDGDDDGSSIADLGAYEFQGAIYSVGGEVSGLVGTGLTLTLNQAETLPINDNGAFVFTQLLSGDASYQVVISQQPDDPLERCQISNGEGTIDSADVSDIAITCETLSPTIFGDRFEP